MINLAQKILIFIYSKKKKNFEPIQPKSIVKKSSNVLILLPEEKELISEIQFLISIFDKVFKQKTFLIHTEIHQTLNLNGDFDTVIYSKEQRNFIKLPKKELIKFLQLKNFDTIIDCNLRDSNFHYWITKNLDAKLKIGLYRKNSTLFYNLVMKVKHIENIRSVYENFLYLLKL